MVSQSPLTQSEPQLDFETLMPNPLALSGVPAHGWPSRPRLQAHPGSLQLHTGRRLVGGFAVVQSRDKLCAGK